VIRNYTDLVPSSRNMNHLCNRPKGLGIRCCGGRDTTRQDSYQQKCRKPHKFSFCHDLTCPP
jgi:hypothetical protein